MNIYQLTGHYGFLLARMQESEEVSEEEMSELLKADGDLEEKLDKYGHIINQLESDSEQLDKEEKRLAKRRMTNDKNAERMKKAIANTLIALGEEKKKTPHYNFSFRKSSVVELKDKDESQFIAWAMKYGKNDLYNASFTTNKKAIREALENGDEIPAYIVEKKKLQIK